MNLRLALAATYLPDFVKRRRLAELLRRTTEALGVEAPVVAGQSLAECLRTYAAVTTVEAERVCRGDAVPEAAARLRATARELGAEMRRTFRIRTQRDAMAAARLLYRVLGIDFQGRADGAIAIRRCYFADWYSPRVCALMSALDEGVLAGLAGEGRLGFTRRITEGDDRCEATFHRVGAAGSTDPPSGGGSAAAGIRVPPGDECVGLTAARDPSQDGKP